MPDPILVATSNAGKLRDFAGAAQAFGVDIAALPGFAALPLVEEDGDTFEANARKKAEAYSRHAPKRIVIADDSGLEVAALNGAPGLHSARYASADPTSNSSDAANNEKLLRELAQLPQASRHAQFVCVIAAAKDGRTLKTFTGSAPGEILSAPRGTDGFGYDPLFLVVEAGKTFAELNSEEKSRYSHRGAAFRQFLGWLKTQDKT
ncbi:MAG TPA: RdgB/HAM1 family non-canonical purine NTP pyrophosphatase [Terriglobales bacterium]|nr:RdgB/HAM1 family non-canonical purine NTP pyrophosphatase [Terriglobales bacterium]